MTSEPPGRSPFLARPILAVAHQVQRYQRHEGAEGLIAAFRSLLYVQTLTIELNYDAQSFRGTRKSSRIVARRSTLDSQRQASILTLSRALLASNPIERRRGPCVRERTHGPSLSQQLSFVLKTHVCTSHKTFNRILETPFRHY